MKMANLNIRYLIFILFQLVCTKFIIAQQNFINVPSAEVTSKKKIFFQQQINISDNTQSNSTIDYGLGNSYEIGLNVLSVNFDNKYSILKNDSVKSEPYYPLVLLNGLKQFEINEKTSISIGAQLGYNFTNYIENNNASMAYINYRIKDLLIKNAAFVFGTFYNSLHYGGSGNRIGFWAATEIPLNNYLHAMAETIIGPSAISFSSIGLIYYPLKWMPLTFGIQVPNQINSNASFVFELTILPIDKSK
jgi:hypothetical protein